MRVRALVLVAMLLCGCTSVSVPSPSNLTITTTELPPASTRHPYMYQLTATGGTAPYTWSVVAGSLPAGIQLSSSGALTGTPTQQGSFNFTVQVIDSAKFVAKIQIGGKTNDVS